jgi:hypothetical protein
LFLGRIGPAPKEQPMQVHDLDAVCANYAELYGVRFSAPEAGCSAFARRCTKPRSPWCGSTGASTTQAATEKGKSDE